MRYWIIFSLCVGLFAPHSHAQIYTWTDDKGRIHYADQPTDKRAVLQSHGAAVMAAPKLVSVTKPGLFESSLHPLIVSRFEYSQTVLDASKVVARFYFGSDCGSPSALNIEQLRTQLPSVLRSPEQLQVDTFRAIRRLGHNSLYRAGHYSGPALENTVVRYLNAEIMALEIAACNLNGSNNSGVSGLSESRLEQFEITNVWLKVRWDITSKIAEKPLLSLVTEGSAASQVNADVKLISALRESFLAAAANALSDNDVRQVLTASSN